MLLKTLHPRDQGIVLAALTHEQNVESCCQQLASSWGERCLVALQEMQQLDAARRRALIIQLTRSLYSPLPMGIEHVHPSWIAHLLAQEPLDVRQIVLDLLPPPLPRTIDPFLQHALTGREPTAEATIPARSTLLSAMVRPLCQRIFAPLQPMTPPLSTCSPIHAVEDLDTWPADRLASMLTYLGCFVLAAISRHTDATLTQALFAHLQPPYDDRVRHALRAPPFPLPRGLRPPQARNISSAQLLRQLGAHVLRPALKPLLAQRVAQRLARELGVSLLNDPPRRGLVNAAGDPGSARDHGTPHNGADGDGARSEQWGAIENHVPPSAVVVDLVPWVNRADYWSRGEAP